MSNILILLIILLGIKFTLNFVRYLQCKHYLSLYGKYLKDPNWDFIEYSYQIRNLFKSAGVSDSNVSNVELAGYGYVRTSQPSVFDNIHVPREDIVPQVSIMFHHAIGVYRSRMIETINPLYWIEFFIFLPKHIMNYLGVSPENILIKIFQIVYWLLTILTGFIFTLYQTEIENIVKAWINNSFP